MSGGARRGVLDRLIALGQPRWDEALRPAPHALADGLFAIERRFFMPGGLAVPTRSLAVRTPGGALAVISPPPDEVSRRDAAALGRVGCLIAPNSFHYGGLASWARAFPEARVFLAPGLRARRPELPAGEALAEGVATPFEDALPHTVLGPVRGISEVAFLHASSRTLILTDACFHILEAPRRDRLGWRLLGAWQRFGPSRTARTILLRDRARVAEFVERMCGWDFERIVVAHGEALEGAGPALLREAFRAYL
jgi:hypothetical protein